MSMPKLQAGILLLSSLLMSGDGLLLARSQNDTEIQKDTSEPPNALDLLKRVGKRYRDLKDYRFQIHLLTEIQSESLRKSLQTDFDISISRLGKSRITITGALGEVQAVSDGTTIWTFLPEIKQYSRQSLSPSAVEPAGNRAFALTVMAKDLASQYEKISEQVTSAKVLRRESVRSEDRTAECWVVAVSSDEPAKESDPKSLRTYWVDAASHLVLKSVHVVRLDRDEDGEAIETRTILTLKQASVDETFPESWFAFEPPPGASEVRQFRPPRASGIDLIGQEAPDFQLKVLAGERVRLKSLHGQVVLLNFWASWCGPCRLEMPTIEKLHREFKRKGLEVFGINDEDIETIREYLGQYEYTFPTLLDEDQEVARLYRVRGIPTMVVIDRQGTVSYYRTGLSREGDLRKWLQKAGIE